ncbi:acyltransferase domain-containing protein [Streptomyces sp. NBC_01092]|uniref:acyltransferase domain-containing protein n=1 Tax=Streptomyces sp. NBC_01092 TaxID=2903748 RepID=UPI00386484A6|nr:acyltransferase domain-containing protein [Streptomyces sp. NBC_01092]
MGARLLKQSPVFADAVHRCAEALRPWIDFDVVDVLRGADGAPPLECSVAVQPALYVSLAELWGSYGVQPSAVIGHSQREIAAAHVAGALTLEDAAKVVAVRSQALRSITGAGGMPSLGLPEDRARALLERWTGLLEIAAVNGPSSMAVAVYAHALNELLQHCAAGNIWGRRLPVDYASHCFHLDAVRNEVTAGLDGLREHLISVHADASGMSVSTRQVGVDSPVSSRDILLAIAQWIIVRDLCGRAS